jgi:hypothetical protein
MSSQHNNHHSGKNLEYYMKFVIYGVTVIIAAFYFYKINKGKRI